VSVYLGCLSLPEYHFLDLHTTTSGVTWISPRQGFYNT
jgi:hypothetical protein